jgi:hypothetical protein
MTDPPNEDRGRVITYLDTSDPDHGEFQKAMVTGVGVLDPESEVVWLPAVRSDGTPALVDPGLILKAAHTAEHAGPNPRPVGIFADALGILAFEMTEVDERAPMAVRTARHLLARFSAAVAPIAQALFMVAEADPDGGLAIVLGCVTLAAEHFEHGDVGNGKAGILTANAAMAELAFAEPDEPDFSG